VSVGQRGKSLACNKLARLGVWDIRVFKRESQAKTKSVAVHLLTDRSSSMNNAEMQAALTSTLAAYKAICSAPEANAGVSVFPGFGGGDFSLCIPHGKGRGARKYEENFARIMQEGCTPFAQAVEGCRLILKNQNADRRILIVITDGMIGYETDFEGLLNRVKKDGVELCLLTIGSFANPLPSYVKHWAGISQSNIAVELAPAVLKMTKEMLVS
jgi:Mg-chelatase subunit ChlD